MGGNRGVKIVQPWGAAGSIALPPSTATYNSYYSYNQTWQAGQTFTTYAGTRVSIDWISSSDAQVTVSSSAGAATAAIGNAAASNSSLGSPTSNVICGLRDGGCYQMFQNGAINYAPGIGAFATGGAIRAAWAATGFENGKLGYPAATETCRTRRRAAARQMFPKRSHQLRPRHRRLLHRRSDPRRLRRTGFERQTRLPHQQQAADSQGGCYQMFQNGAINYAPGIGAFATGGAIRAAWAATGFENGKLGYPTSNETCGLTNNGCYQMFQNGAINYAPGIGAFATGGAIRTAWAATGFENGKLGYPTSNETCGLTNNGCQQMFQKGVITNASAAGAFAVTGAIQASWKSVNAEKGKLGYPTSNETCGLVNGGCWQAFQGGTVHSAPGVGAFATWGGIRSAWAAAGYENGKLGYPTSNETCGLTNNGCYQMFQNGAINYAPGIGAFATGGAIRTTWAATGYENGKLGYPTSNETCGLTNNGCLQAFQNGVITYSPTAGAFAVTGAIQATWTSLNAEKGKLGYPTSNQTCGLVNGGCWQAFQGGTVHSAPGVGAFATGGAIRTAWAATGYENGKLGYPTSNETCGLTNNGCQQTFQGGTITWSPSALSVALKP